MPVKVAEEWLAVCAGCEVTLLDLGPALLNILPQLDFVHIPVLMDHKYYGQTGEGTKMEIPEADVGIISGAIRTEENKEVAREMRNKCKVIVANGSCACFGGIPSLANMFRNEEILDKVYKGTKSTIPGTPPTTYIPPWTDRVYALDEVIKVDVSIPGCPAPADLVGEAITALLENKPFKLEEKAVCEECPLKREKKVIAPGTALKRPLEMPPDPQRCIFEQGYLCLGPATRTGCGGAQKVPRCIKGGVACRGCFGPLRAGASQMVDMMGALATIGLDVKLIPDRAATFNRFVGAKARLRPR